MDQKLLCNGSMTDILRIERHAWLCTNVILSVVRVGIQSLEFFIELRGYLVPSLECDSRELKSRKSDFVVFGISEKC